MCYCTDSSIAITVNLFQATHDDGVSSSPCLPIQLGKTRNLGCMNEEMWDSNGSLIQS